MNQDRVFPERLRAARKARGLSQNGLYRLSGIPSCSISRLEGGGARPSYDSLLRLVTALEVSADYLIGCSDIMEVRHERTNVPKPQE
jgi:transcriptional regulator with XRE-family HTH domain